MIFETKYSYTVEARLRGRKGAKSFLIEEAAPIQIEDIDSTIAPIAYWWHPTALCDASSSSDVYPAQVAVRLVDGKLYQPMVAWKNEETFAPVDGAFMRNIKKSKDAIGLLDAAAVARTLETGHLFSTLGRYKTIPRREPDIDPLLIREVKSSNRDARLAEMANHYAKFLFIDGIVHFQTPVPFVKVDLERWGNSIQLREPDTLRFSQPWNVFSMARFDEARNLYRKRDANTVPPARVDWKLLTPEILIPEAVEVDEHGFMVRAVARDVLDRVGDLRRSFGYGWSSRLSGMPVDAVVAYGELRDAWDDKMPTAEIYRLLMAFSEVADFPGIEDGIPKLQERLQRDGADFLLEMEMPQP